MQEVELPAVIDEADSRPLLARSEQVYEFSGVDVGSKQASSGPRCEACTTCKV